MKKIAICSLLVAMFVGAADAATRRGTAANANAYVQNARNNYFLINQPDVDTACRTKIFACLAQYCGDVTVVPGQRAGRCTYATESELYNYALLCLQRDNSILLPQYGVNTVSGANNGMNTAGRLCPSYVQQELMAYLSMANLSEQLNKSHSSVCVQRRQELEAAMACHSVALAYGNETASMLNSQLTDYCGNGVPGGSSEMVTRFANAGNVGANIWGWAEKIISLDLNKKGEDWQQAIDSVLAGYTNRMNLACGDDMQINTVNHSTSGSASAPTVLQTAAALAVGVAFPTESAPQKESTIEAQPVAIDVRSMHLVENYDQARQVVNAGLTNTSITQNAYLNAGTMDTMQRAFAQGTKVFVLRDDARCYIVPVAELDFYQRSLVAQSYANCISQ